MKIALACDHGGFKLKEEIKAFLQQKRVQVLDLGCHNEEVASYAEHGKACGEAIARGDAESGIVICGTGVGISIAANKVKGVRCALCTNVYMAETSRQFIDANIIALGSKVLERELALDIVDRWLTAEFKGGEYQNNINILDAI